MQTQAGPLVGPDDDSRSPTIAGVLVDRRVDHLEDLHGLLREEELEVSAGAHASPGSAGPPRR